MGHNIQLFHTFLNDSQNYQPREWCGPPDELLLKAEASDHSSSGSQQYLRADNFDCRPERYDIDVLLADPKKYSRDREIV